MQIRWRFLFGCFLIHQRLHGHAQDGGDGFQFDVGGAAGLAFQFGEAGGVDVHAQQLHPGHQGGLLHAEGLADALHIGAADIFGSVCCFSWFQNVHLPVCSQMEL